MKITRKNRTYEVEQIKFCSLSSGIKIYLFRKLDGISKFSGRFIVAVKQRSETLHFVHLQELKTAINYYLDYICEYA